MCTHYAVTGYACGCATCILSASATVQAAHPQAHPLNSYKITDIYSQCSADYDLNAEITREFFATVQNKLHYAAAGKTAAEIVYTRADSTKKNMGLTTWKNAPKGAIRKSDVSIAKNYLQEKEI